MKKVLSVFLMLGLLLSVGFASDLTTKIPQKSASQNFVESIDSYLHYELINPATSKEFKDQINFFLNEREKTGNFRFDLMPSGKVFIISGKAILKIENENFISDIFSVRLFNPGHPEHDMEPGLETGGGGAGYAGGNVSSGQVVKTICKQVWNVIEGIATLDWVCTKITSFSGDNDNCNQPNINPNNPLQHWNSFKGN